MCIIIAKPNGADLPSAETLRACAEINPDGCGMALCRKGSTTTEVIKGAYQIDKFLAILSKLNITEDDQCILHFRIATSGLITSENAHPFPISHRRRDLTLCHYTSTRVIAHNGVIPIATPGAFSDTMEFVTAYLAFLPTVDDIEDLYPEFVLGSRFAAIEHGELKLIGDGWTFRGDGCAYSNLHFQPLMFWPDWPDRCTYARKWSRHRK
jgi:hypothetical protein